MAIDPKQFHAQGKPSVDIVRTVWEGMAHPSCRKVADQLKQRGWSITHETVARYRREGFRPLRAPAPPPIRKKKDDGPVQLSVATIEALEKLVAEEAVKQAGPTLNEIPEATDAPLAPGTTEPKEDPNVTRRRTRAATLLGSNEDSLRKLAVKTRLVAQIVLHEEAVLRADLLVLVPKDLAAFIKASAESESALPAPTASGLKPDEKPPANDPKTIEHLPVVNEVADKLAAFRRKQGMTG